MLKAIIYSITVTVIKVLIILIKKFFFLFIINTSNTNVNPYIGQYGPYHEPGYTSLDLSINEYITSNIQQNTDIMKKENIK